MEGLVYPFESKPEHLGLWGIVEEFEDLLPPDRLAKVLEQDHYWFEYRNFGGPAVASTGYGLAAAALAEASGGIIASFDCAFDCEHNGETAEEFLAWWGHVFESLPEGDDSEAEAFEVLAHLDGAPTVISNLANIEPEAELFDVVLDMVVAHHIAFSGFQVALLMPQVVGDVIAGDPQFQVVFGNPKPGRDRVFVIVPVGWEYENESSDIGGGCQVEPAVTNPALKFCQIDWGVVLIPDVHRHPPHAPLHPLIKP